MRKKISLLLVIGLFFGLLINTIILSNQIKNITGTSEEINNIGRIRGGIQRATKFTFANQDSKEIRDYVDQVIVVSKKKIPSSRYFDNIKKGLDELEKNWSNLKSDMIQYETNPSETLKNKIIKESEMLWDSSDILVTASQKDQENNLKKGSYIFIGLGFNLVFLFFLFLSIKDYIKGKTQYYADHDFLTKLYNRRFFMEKLEIEYAKAKKKKEKMCCILLDIDKFKDINDQYGHQQGDRILVELSRLLETNIRKTDLLCRFGGEEFLVVLLHTQAEEALGVAEKIRKIVEAYDFNLKPITISLGIYQNMEKDTVDTFIEKADQAMYQAKISGRNQSVLFPKENS